MHVPARFLRVVREGWQVWATPSWVPQIGTILEEAQRVDGWMHRSKHARTRRLCLPGVPSAYLKTYQPYSWAGTIKDAARASKALRAMVMSDGLERAGLAAARVLAAGEHRHFGLLRGAFLVTRAVDAPDVREFISTLAGSEPLVTKRRFLGMLGAYVAQLHEAGFYHGDLVPTNVRVKKGERAGPQIVLLDHDRTRATWGPVPLRRARRNLVQLNRFVVEGLTAVDRWRVLRAYCASRYLDERTSRSLARWIVRKTIERRRRFDGIEAAQRMSFRSLMRVAGPKFTERSG